MTLGDTTISVEVVSTPALQERGLSGRVSLPEGSGMLFVFDEPDLIGIWMKDMRFSIDIVWIDESGTVVTVAPNATPESYPKVFYPLRPARYVLEVPAGFAAEHGVAEGSRVEIKNANAPR